MDGSEGIVNGEVVAPKTPGQAFAALTPNPSPDGEGGEGQATTTTPVYMTEDQVKALMLAQREEMVREIQSRTDKSSSRIEKQVKATLTEVEKSLSLLKDAGQEITPEIRERIRQRVIADAYAEGGETPKPLTPDPSPDGRGGEGGQQVHPVLEESFQIIRALGLKPEELSPDAVALIDQQTTDANAFLASVRKAAAFEYARVQNGNGGNNGVNVPNGARVAGMGAVGARRGNPIETVTDPGELFRLAEQSGRI